MKLLVSKSSLSGKIQASPSKSHTIRSILFGFLAKGETTITDFLPSPDTTAMITACSKLGAKISVANNKIFIEGCGGNFAPPKNILNVGNSGQVLRFISAISALISDYVVLTGDRSIKTLRPMRPLLDGLRGLGCWCRSTRQNGLAPVIIKGPVSVGKTQLDGQDSQPVSALLILAACLNGTTEIEVFSPGEKPWIDLTISWLNRFGIQVINNNYSKYFVTGKGLNFPAFDYTVPGDFSSILFPITAAILTNSSIEITNVDMLDVQGDKKVLHILKSMGAKIEWDENAKKIWVSPGSVLRGINIDINDCIDSIAILAVIGCFAENETIITGAAIARKKESDRISAIVSELKKMGANIRELSDGVVVKKSNLISAAVNSFNDHRIAMSLAVAAMATSEGTAEINGGECYKKSYPRFYEDFLALGAKLEIC